MKIRFCFTALLAILPWGFACAEPGKPTFDAEAFGALPVQAGGRVQPLDSIARNSLLLLRQKSSVSFSKAGPLVPQKTSEADFYSKKPSTWTDADRARFREDELPLEDKKLLAALEQRGVTPAGNGLDADTWLAEVTLRPHVAKHFRVFRIDHPEVVSLLGLKPRSPSQYSWAEIGADFGEFAKIAESAAQKDAGLRSPFEKAALKLATAATRYHMLTVCTLIPGDLPPEIPPVNEYWTWLGTLRESSDQLAASKDAGSPGKLDPQTQRAFLSLVERYREFNSRSKIGIVPPRTAEEIKARRWANLGGALLDVTDGKSLDAPPVLPRYVELASAYRAGDDATANAKVRELAAIYADGADGYSRAKVSGECLFNRVEPFYRGLTIYAVAGFLVLIGWVASRRWPVKAASWLIALAFAVHTAGLVSRMWIQDRPPVTNLYSSAVFVAWGAVLICLILERFLKNGVALLVAAITGFGGLVVAHQLGISGEDTIEMMRAVLDSNFWLATHVVVVTAGYVGMFVAGFLALIALIRRVIDRDFDEAAENTVRRAAYGALCFAALASFTGTMLGGIWADQSWGRFWGWDAKENGALLVVLWAALTLHARLAGLAKGTGFFQLLLIGNIVTAWSWFGTNLIGVGLHSYGFNDSTFWGIVWFVLSQVAIIPLGWCPARRENKRA